MQETSIRFFNDTPLRAVWDEAQNKWFFSVLDILAAIRGVADYDSNRNYWKYLKNKLKKENSQVVSLTNRLKLNIFYFPIRIYFIRKIIRKYINIFPEIYQ